MKVAVITSSIGRPELAQCIESVKAQTYSQVQHWVFVNGPKYHDSASKILDKYPDVPRVYLPEETGDYGAGGSMADVFVAAPFLINADWIFYLNDDDFYDPDHVESILTLATNNDLKWVYSLRKFVTKTGQLVCDDNWCSLGYWPILADTRQHLIDNSCYAIQGWLAKKCALSWTHLPLVGDRCFFQALRESRARSGCTGRSTVSYRLGTGSGSNDLKEIFHSDRVANAAFPNGFPWRTPTIFSP